VRSGRFTLGGTALVAAGAAAWLLLGDQPLPAGPLPVETGETMQQTFTDDEGNTEVWTFKKSEVARETLPDLVLPKPALRETPPGEHTKAARALSAQALDSWKSGEIERAVELFESAVEADPEDTLPHSDFGRILMLMTVYDRAFPHLERAAQLAPNDPRVWLDLLSFYDRTLLLERSSYARQRAEQLTGGQEIVRDETGLWVIDGESIFQ